MPDASTSIVVPSSSEIDRYGNPGDAMGGGGVQPQPGFMLGGDKPQPGPETRIHIPAPRRPGEILPGDFNRKCCIMGFADSSRDLAPFDMPQFEIWGINELYKFIPRAELWFELHKRDEIEITGRNHAHIDWLRKSKIPIFMQNNYEDIKFSWRYPIEEMVQLFGTYFTNTISYMMAYAIVQGYGEIHIYGVDMAQDSEYGLQRPSCEYFIGLARGMGRKVFLPNTSDLLKIAQLYGYESRWSMWDKMNARKNEMAKQRDEAAQQARALEARANLFNGAVDDISYWLRNWKGSEK